MARSIVLIVECQTLRIAKWVCSAFIGVLISDMDLNRLSVKSAT